MTRPVRRVAVVVALVVALGALAAACSGDDDADGADDDAGPTSTTEAASSSTSSSTTAPTPATIPGVAVDLVELPGRPSAVAVGHGALWVADDDRGTVQRLDPCDGEELSEPEFTVTQPIALAAGGDVVWVAGADGSIDRLRADTGEAAGAFTEIASATVDIVADDRTGGAWVADIEESRVVALAADGAIVDEIEIPDGAVRLAVVGSTLWVSNLESSVTPVDLDAGTVGESIDVGTAPIGMAVAGEVLWVTSSEGDELHRLDATTGEVVGDPVAVGDAPVAVVAGGDHVWSIDQDGATASRVDPAAGTVAPLDLGFRPRAAVAGPAGPWVAGVDPSGVVSLTSGASCEP